MNTIINHERLDRLSAEIETLDETVRELSRRARTGDALTIANAVFLIAEEEVKLSWALRSHFVEARVVRNAEKAQSAAQRARQEATNVAH